jgi:GNAT superfamily N-acetyltransferase
MKVRVATDARGRMVRVIVHELQDAVLFPIYTATEKLKDATISIKLISDYAEKQQVLDLLERLHYRRHASGMILAAFHRTNLVGCAVMSRLTFGRPRRRFEYLRQMSPNKTAPELAITPIMWVRRFATAEEFEGRGVATTLARHVIRIAKDYFRPVARFVEVITSRTVDEISTDGERLQNDFLMRAGYRLVGDPWPDNGKLENRWINERRREESVRVKYFYYIHSV